MSKPLSLWMIVGRRGHNEECSTYLCLGEAGEMHLLVEKVNHLLLWEPEWDVADIDPPGLAGDGGAHHGHGGLERWGLVKCCGFKTKSEYFALEWKDLTFLLAKNASISFFPTWGVSGMRVAGIWPLCCMLLYCMGVMCSNPGGGTSQYRLGLRLLEDFLPRSRSRDLELKKYFGSNFGSGEDQTQTLMLHFFTTKITTVPRTLTKKWPKYMKWDSSLPSPVCISVSVPPVPVPVPVAAPGPIFAPGSLLSLYSVFSHCW